MWSAGLMITTGTLGPPYPNGFLVISSLYVDPSRDMDLPLVLSGQDQDTVEEEEVVP